MRRGFGSPQQVCQYVFGFLLNARRTLAYALQEIFPQSTLIRTQPVIPPPKPEKVDWPQPVRDYVQRAFAPEHKIPGIEKQELEAKLKEVITQAAQTSQLHSKDWNSIALPQDMIASERQALVPVSAHGSYSSTITPEPRKLRALNSETLSKKRKSTDEMNTQSESRLEHPLWNVSTDRNLFEERVTYPNGSGGVRSDSKRQRKVKAANNARDISSKSFNADLETRKRRFENNGAGTHRAPWRNDTEDSPSPENPGPVVGLSKELEKNYYRLTAPPDPKNVRPAPILKKTLDLLKRKWREANNYAYICDQFKSMRQDLTVQHIKNEFTISVYEIHARIALEKGDLGEYNQCQTQLRGLYSQIKGGHPTEFKAYRILYFIYTSNRTGMNDCLADLTPAERKDPAVKHALDVRSALALGNYHRFFRLYLENHNMGAYLMDMFVQRERLAALANICRA